jgi:hypothetical protein
VHLRWRRRLSPLAIASRLSMSASTVHAVLVRCRLNRLSHIDIRTGDPITLTGDSYERDHSGSLAHVDVKKPGNIPVGGGVALCREDPRAQRAPATSRIPGIMRVQNCRLSTRGSPIPPSDKRQDREIQAHLGPRIGLRTPRHQRTHSPISAAGLAAHLQPPPATLCDRQGPIHHTVDQSAWAVQLVVRVASW